MNTIKLKVGSKVPSAIYTDNENEAPVCVVDTMGEIHGVDVNAAIARRMVACWNVFTVGGVHIDAIEAVDGTETIVFKYAQACRERDHFQALAQDNGAAIVRTATALADVKAQRDALAAEVATLKAAPDFRDPEAGHSATAIAIYTAVTGKTESAWCREDPGEWGKWLRGAIAASEKSGAAAPPPTQATAQAVTEPQRIAADLHRNAMKDSGELQRRETDRALVEQIKWETPT